MATKGTDLFLQVLNERLGLTPQKGAQPDPPARKRNHRATIIAGALAGGVLLASLCSGQTIQTPESPAAPEAPAAAAPAPPQAEPAATPAPATPKVTATAKPSGPAAAAPRRAPERPRRAVQATPPARPASPTAPTATRGVSYTGVAFEQAAWATKGGAVEPAGRPELTDPEAQPIESYRVAAKEGGRSGNLLADVFGKLVLVLGLMLGCAAGWKKLQGVPVLRAVTGGGLAESMEVVESFNLAPQRQLHLVKVSGQRLLIASTPQSVSLIAELDRPAAPPPVPAAPAAPAAATESAEPEKVEQVVEAEPSRYEQIINRLRETLIPESEPVIQEPVREPVPSGLFSAPLDEPEPVSAGSLSGLFRQPAEVRPTAASSAGVTTSFFSTAATPALGGRDA